MPQVPVRETSVERVINLHIEKLPEGVYLATSEDVPGLVVQADTVAEAVEIARDAVPYLLEAGSKRPDVPPPEPVGDCIDIPLIVGA